MLKPVWRYIRQSIYNYYTVNYVNFFLENRQIAINKTGKKRKKSQTIKEPELVHISSDEDDKDGKMHICTPTFCILGVWPS